MTCQDILIALLREDVISAAHPAAAGYTEAQLEAASDALIGLDTHARAWNWRTVETMLDRAYAALGAVNPGTGYEYHCGTHPLQIAYAQECLALDDADDGAREAHRERVAGAELARTLRRQAVRA